MVKRRVKKSMQKEEKVGHRIASCLPLTRPDEGVFIHFTSHSWDAQVFYVKGKRGSRRNKKYTTVIMLATGHVAN